MSPLQGLWELISGSTPGEVKAQSQILEKFKGLRVQDVENMTVSPMVRRSQDSHTWFSDGAVFQYAEIESSRLLGPLIAYFPPRTQ